jgi:hypothetical protein
LFDFLKLILKKPYEKGAKTHEQIEAHFCEPTETTRQGRRFRAGRPTLNPESLKEAMGNFQLQQKSSLNRFIRQYHFLKQF